ncbi:hypothetical protein [Niabella sp.]|uniref:hypothetical protein n=1 Tax=Niabella sp. TaxID=1962976 RepID=UPI00262CDFB1|nr:hypothetical protein [Niabella sp.]
MKHFMLLFLIAISIASCSKQAVKEEKPKSKITVTKNDSPWVSEGVSAHYNVDEDIVHVISGKGTETFTISFKKKNIPLDGIVKDFSAVVQSAPFYGSAAISERYLLETDKPNKLKLLLFEDPEQRIACDFVLYLKRVDQPNTAEESIVFKGRFDVRYDFFSLKDFKD